MMRKSDEYNELHSRHEFVMDVLELFAEYDITSMLSWRTDAEYAPVTFLIDTNDLMAWGCADAERVSTREQLNALKDAIQECVALDPVCGSVYGCQLYACRLNKMRPQGAAYPDSEALWPLFDACGPERETGLGNPYKPGERKRKRAEAEARKAGDAAKVEGKYMAQFRKKPIVIEAIQWLNKKIVVPPGPEWFLEAEQSGVVSLAGDVLYIKTLEGEMRANVGDWIIRGVNGELYPCKNDIFVKTYEPA